MTKVLVSGASGFIGSNILKYLLENTDWEFTCLSSWRHKGNPLNLQDQFTDERATFITLDLVGVIPDLGDFDYIIHMASDSHVDRSITEPVSFIENNVSSTLQMLEYARKHKPKAFIMFSTDEVFGANAHEEWDVLLPSNPYAASKACQEMISIAYWKTYGLPIVITNSNNIVGPNQDPEKFVPKIIDLIKHDKEVTIHVTNGKPGSRHYNPVENVGDAVKFLLGLKPTIYPASDRPDRYSLPGGEELDNLEMAKLVASILGKKLQYKTIDAESVRPGYDEFYPKTDGRMTELGWKSVIELEDSLAKWVK